ncbi:WhiB family transcriptional regulator [Streptomyces spinosus]|uniref:WhiB family transcriptional regulator n=1 Tax=Streptomyces spinosus TaxID=2872623 RepID=UPI001CED508B|nr:WhiB family transcriptional regulator [Streptomyces spinosus]
MSNYTGAVPETKRKTDWRDTAACAGQDPERWFPNPSNVAAVKDAKATCFGCPVIYQCAQGALTRGEESGVWGGLSEGQRVTIRKKYRLAQLEAPGTIRRVVNKALHAELNPTETLRDVWEKHTHDLPGGHIGWSGPTGSFSFRGIPTTPKQLAFLLDRGHKAVGIVRRTCDLVECVNPRHMLDNEERCRQKAEEERALIAALEAPLAS